MGARLPKDSRSRGQLAKALAIGLVALAAGGLVASLASAAGLPDLRGTYMAYACVGVTLAQCEANPTYPQQFTIVTEDFSTGAVTGSGSASNGDTWTVTGTVTSPTTVMLHSGNFKLENYSSDATYTINSDASKLEGTFNDSYGRQNQPTFANRTSSTGTTTGTTSTTTTTTTTTSGKRPTATQVICNYTVATGTDTCGATVGDSGPPPRTTPTGTVSFTSSSGAGFTGTLSCTLTQTPSSPGVASCNVEYLIAETSTFPQITATYQGDPTFAGSSGMTGFLIAGNVSGLTDDNGPSTGSCQAPQDATAAFDPKKIPDKLCDLVAAGALGRVAAIVCAASGPLAETGAAPVACAAALVAAGFSVKWFLDPPDSHFRTLLLPPSSPVRMKAISATCTGLGKRQCRALRASARAYVLAADQVAAAQDGLATTGDRVGSARKAGDVPSLLLQIAGRKIYAGRVAASEALLNRRSASLGRLLAADGLTVTASGGIAGAERSLLRSRPAALRRALALTGLTVKQFGSALASANRLAGGTGSGTLAKVLGEPIAFGPLRADYLSMSLENLRDLARGLTRAGSLSPAGGSAMVLDLACTTAHPKPSVNAFVRDARRYASKAYARLLAFAAKPVLSKVACS